MINIVKHIIPFIISLSMASVGFAQSVLNSGEWFKIGIVEEGVYKLDAAFFQQLGVDLPDLDPTTIKVFGNGGKILPQSNLIARPTELLENSILVTGETDGSFDQGDAVFFYGQSPHTLRYDASSNAYFYENNIYSDTTFYFVTYGTGNGKRVEQTPNLGSGHPIVNSMRHPQVHEFDLTNVLAGATGKGGSGREWYGEIFNTTTSRDFSFEIGSPSINGSTKIISNVLSKSEVTANFKIQVEGQQLSQIEIDKITSSTYSQRGFAASDTIEFDNSLINGSEVNININYSRPKTSSIGHLNYILLDVAQKLEFHSAQLVFESPSALVNDSSTFEIANLSSSEIIWDVTDPTFPTNQIFSPNGSSALFGANTTELKKYIIFSLNVSKTPVSFSTISNQNLSQLGTPQLLIVAPRFLYDEAVRLAQFRESHDGLSSEVAILGEIYNEYGSGSPDISAIRDFAKHLYNSGELKYLLLFGRGTYDYKNKLGQGNGLIPIYESRNSVHPITSYSSDDYFGFFEEDEGEWAESPSGDHTLEIGVGRLPVTGLEEARRVVDKLIDYDMNPDNLGDWRNNISFVADDGDGNAHQLQADRLATLVDTTIINFESKKLYLDRYEQITTPSSQTSPDAVLALNDAVVNQGSLIVNFTGHGNELKWTDESILTQTIFDQWDNQNKLPLFVTATCEFGRNDDPMRISAAENLLLKEVGGAIAVITTARPVYSSSNFLINRAFFDNVNMKENGSHLRLGDIFKQTKNESLNGVNNRNFSLLGDPSMTLAFPDLNISVDDVNGKNLVDFDTLRANSLVHIKGAVRELSGEIATTFDGLVNIELLDKPIVASTLGTESEVFEFSERTNILFRGQATVGQGQFEFEFVVPQNIDYRLGRGKLSFYAINENVELQDASGANINLIIGESTQAAITDTKSPEITLFVGDTTFSNGDLASSSTFFIANLSDENGINLSNIGINTTLRFILDDSIEYLVPEFYSSSVDDHTLGWVYYPVNDIPWGQHQLKIIAADVFGNVAQKTTNFRVSEGNDLIIEELKNYPNPFRDGTRFSFSHNRAGDDLEIELQVLSTSGKLVENILESVVASPGTIELGYWATNSNDGGKILPGMYVYKLVVRSLNDGAKTQKVQKLLIIN